MSSTAIQKARKQLAGQEKRVPSVMSRDAIQFAWYAPLNLKHRDQGEIKRCRWTPIIKRERWMSILAKPSVDEFAAVRNSRNPSKPPTEGLEWIKPGAIANSLYDEFAAWGLLISPSLGKANISLDEFEALNLDEIYFPMADDELPRTYSATKSQIEQVLNAIQSGGLKQYPKEAVTRITAVGREMLDSLERTKAYFQAQLDITHQGFEDSKTKEGFRGKYDQRDRAMMAWLEIVPRDEVQNSAAKANETLIELAKQQLVSGNKGMDATVLAEALAKALGPLLKR